MLDQLWQVIALVVVIAVIGVGLVVGLVRGRRGKAPSLPPADRPGASRPGAGGDGEGGRVTTRPGPAVTTSPAIEAPELPEPQIPAYEKPESARGRLARLRARLDQIHRQFIAVVREGRGARLKETPETFSGLFWNGEEAIKLGLADKLGNLDYVAREVVKAEEVIDYTPQDNVAERLAKRFGASVGAGAVRALRSSVTLH